MFRSIQYPSKTHIVYLNPMSHGGKNVGKKLMYVSFTLKMLTDRALKNLKPKEKPYKKADSLGLYVRVLPNGSIYFQHRFCFHGKEQIDSLGVHLETSILDAREKLSYNRKLLLRDGINPAQEKKTKKLQEKIQTLESQSRIYPICI